MGQAYLFGVILSFLMQPVGMVLIIILPCVLIIALEVAKIVKAFTADKKQQELAEKEEKERELEELRSRLAALEQEKNEIIKAQAPADKTEGKEE
jgi:cell shape-determining protein MreC